MESSKNPFNRYSDSMKPESLGKGEVAVFEVVGRRCDVNVPPLDLIYDKEIKDYVQIALVKGLDRDGTPILDVVRFFIRTGGKITLRGGNHNHDRIYKYFQLCNFNGSNPDRDDKTRVIFREVKPESNAQGERDKRKLSRDAVQFVEQMSDEAVIEYFQSKGKAANMENIIRLRNQLEKTAEKDPLLFLKEKPEEVMEAAESDVEKKCKSARKKGLIDYDKENFTWSFVDGDKICSIPRVAGVKQYAELVSHLLNKPEGKSQYELILKGLSEE